MIHHQIATPENQLVTRGDMQESISTAVSAAVAELKEFIYEGFQTFGDRLEERFKKIDERFDLQDKRFDEFGERFLGVETRIGGVEVRIGGVETRIGGLENRMGAMEDRTNSRFDRFEQKMEAGFALCAKKDDLRSPVKRIERLEEAVGIEDIEGLQAA